MKLSTSLLLFAVILLFRCTTPTDSDPDYSLAQITVLPFSETEEDVFFTGEEVAFRIGLSMPHLFDHITYSRDNHPDGYVPARYEREANKTIEIGMRFDEPGTYVVAFTATLGNNQTRRADISVVIEDHIADSQYVYWVYSVHIDSVYEGETLSRNLNEFVSNEENREVDFSLSGEDRRIELNDSILLFSAGIRDSGTYLFSVMLQADDETYDLTLIVRVQPAYYTVEADDHGDSGRVVLTPQKEQYRLGDTVTVGARAAEGFVFVGWSKGGVGYEQTLELVIVEDLEIAAEFMAAEGSGCIEISGGSINELIQHYSPREMRPQVICTRPGMYENDRIRISGDIRIVIE